MPRTTAARVNEMNAGASSSATRWYALDAPLVARALSSDVAGLSDAEAGRRLAELGPNELEPERSEPVWRLFVAQLRDPLIYVLLAAAVITAVLDDPVDTTVILVVVVLNAVIGSVQEARARRAVQSLARLAAPHARVVRDGRTREVASRTLVPGDLVILEAGARVPADLRLTEVHGLEIDESTLTGESVSVRKATAALPDRQLVPGDQANIAFGGTAATLGHGRGIVVQTGAASELGRIAESMRALGSERTPLQEKLDRFGRRIGWLVLALSAIVLVVGLARDLPLTETLLTAVALAVSAVPEGLPLVLTITLAAGMRRMALRRAIVRTLPSVETLGSTTVIGTDKTGTLTENRMTVRALWVDGRRLAVANDGSFVEEPGGAIVAAGDNAALRALLETAVLASETDPEGGAGDPTEHALHRAARAAGIDPAALRRDHRELELVPFSSERRYMASLRESPAGRVLHLKGSPEAIAERCAMARPSDGHAIAAAATALAASGLRVMAMASRRSDALSPEQAGGCTFLGLAGLEDPLRPAAADAVAAARAAGVRVLMLTGDHVGTARAIGRRLGFARSGHAIEGRDLDLLDDAALDRTLETVDVYARVAPNHKLRIVQRLRARGEIVAVTGDGVNDAPALRAADVGVAMGVSGTDVAREAADVVLADDDFATLTAAIEEGRVVFANIRKVAFFLLSTATGEVMTILAALFAGWPLPFTPVQLLWINLVTDSVQVSALAFERGEPDILRRPPRPPAEEVLPARLLFRLGLVGALLTAGTLGVYQWVLAGSGDAALARSAALTQMVVFQCYHAFNCRSLDRSIVRAPPTGNRALLFGVAGVLALHVAALHAGPLRYALGTRPLTPGIWVAILLVGAVVVIGGELDKATQRRRHRPLG